MKCCANCFSNSWLRDYIRHKAREEGACGFCGSAKTRTINVEDIYAPSSNLLDMYAPVQAGVNIFLMEDPWNHGDSLSWLLQEDWDLFSESVLDSDKIRQEPVRHEDLVIIG